MKKAVLFTKNFATFSYVRVAQWYSGWLGIWGTVVRAPPVLALFSTDDARLT
jgi:hypothetical protein